MEGALTMRKSMIVPVLLLSLLLTACGGEEAGSGRNSFWDELGVDETETVLVVDGREIPAWRYCWWLAAGCREMKDACAAGGLAVDWDAVVETETLGDYVQRQAVENTVLYAAVETLAEKWGAACTTEPTGETIQQETGLLLEDWQRQELERVGLLYGELCAMAAAEDSPLVTEEELAAFAEQEEYLTIDRIVFLFGEDKETARRQAEEAFARLNSAADKEAVFSALSAGDGSDRSETVQAGAGTLAPEILAAADSLALGQYSGILETADGYCILRRMAPDRKTLAPVWLEWELLQAAASAQTEEKPGIRNLTAAAVSQMIAAAKAEQ